MKKINLKALVTTAVKQEWPAFAEAHPHLAAILSEDVMIEPCAASLAQNPDYMTSLKEAVAIGIGIETLQDLVRDWTRDWLDRLM